MTGKTFQAGLNGASIQDGTVTVAELAQASRMALAAQNPIHNGGFNVWQRGSTFTSPTLATYGPDRWCYVTAATSAVHDLSRSTDVPAVATTTTLTNYSALLDCTTADAAVAAGDLVTFRHVIEGYNFQPFAQQAFTLGFWVKATKTGTYCVSFKNSVPDRSYIAEYTVSVADTWEYKTITVSASPSAGTWDYTTGIGLFIDFTLMSGSTYQTTASAWQAGHYYSTSSQVNACDSTSNNFRIWGVTLGLGSSVAPFWPRPFSQELDLCRRYYYKSIQYPNPPGTAGIYIFLQPVETTAIMGTRFRWTLWHPVPMRTTPTLRHWDSAGTLSKMSVISNDTITDNITPLVTLLAANESNLSVTSAQGAPLFQFDASADL